MYLVKEEVEEEVVLVVVNAQGLGGVPFAFSDKRWHSLYEWWAGLCLRGIQNHHLSSHHHENFLSPACCT
jgi:hypothetical protein